VDAGVIIITNTMMIRHRAMDTPITTTMNVMMTTIIIITDDLEQDNGGQWARTPIFTISTQLSGALEDDNE